MRLVIEESKVGEVIQHKTGLGWMYLFMADYRFESGKNLCYENGKKGLPDADSRSTRGRQEYMSFDFVVLQTLFGNAGVLYTTV